MRCEHEPTPPWPVLFCQALGATSTAQALEQLRESGSGVATSAQVEELQGQLETAQDVSERRAKDLYVLQACTRWRAPDTHVAFAAHTDARQWLGVTSWRLPSSSFAQVLLQRRRSTVMSLQNVRWCGVSATRRCGPCG